MKLVSLTIVRSIFGTVLLSCLSSCSDIKTKKLEKEDAGIDVLESPDLQSQTDTIWVESLKAYHPNVALLRQYFNDAAGEFNVPVRLLMAIGVVESNWTQIGRPSIDQGWGIMHLSDSGSCMSLSLASELMNVSPINLKRSARLNIKGGAAVLDAFASESGINRDNNEEWLIPISRYSCLINENLRQDQAHAYMRIYNEGNQSPTIWGDTILMPPKPPNHE